MQNILKALEAMLQETQLHRLSYNFHLLLPDIKEANVKFRVIEQDCFYANPDLDEVLAKKRLAVISEDFGGAADFRKEEKRILQSKPPNSLALVSAQRGFVLEGYIVRAYLAPQFAQDRLLSRLLKESNLIYDT